MTAKALLFAGAALFWVAARAAAQESAPAGSAGSSANPAQAQPLPPDITGDYGDESDQAAIVVTGQKARGSVIGDIPPQNTLDSRDIQATGATDINDLLDALAPEIGSAQGRGGERPILLLDGQRISSWRELRDIPTEAIERVEILPEEVALKYGYSANQKVVNFVLRRFFRSTTALLRDQVATEGGYNGGTGDLTRFMVGDNGRTTLNLHAEGNGMLTEAERNITLETLPGITDVTDDRAARSLVGSKLDLRGSGTFNRKIGDVGATLNTELEHNQGRSLFGLSDVDATVLARHTTTDTAHAGLALNWGSKWQWSSTANADFEHDLTRSDRPSDGFTDRASSTSESADADVTAHGDLLALPAGSLGMTARVGVSALHLNSEHRGPDDNSAHSLSRNAGGASINVDLPVSRRGRDFAALGNLSLNANARLQHLSDFGTLTTLGAGTHWSPIDKLDLIASWTREEGPPTVQQLGNPLLETPGSRLFDFTTGQTVLANVITGGNPNLQSDRRTVEKLSGNWQPFEKVDLRLRAEYVHQHIDRPIADLPGPTAPIEAAFPDRFVRNAQGELISADLRPVNYDSSRQDTLRIGFDFTHPLKSARPSAAAMAAFRQRAGGRQQGGSNSQANAQQGNGSSSSASGGQQQNAEAAPGGGRSGRGFRGGRFGRGDRGRVMFSLTDTVTFVDDVTIRPGLKLDYLHGDAIGQTGGRPRHDVEGRASYYNNGLGARLTGEWRSGTEVDTATGDDLHFSPYATFNLRLWANLGERYDLVAKHPFFRGSSVRFEVGNIFNAKPNVTNSAGRLPFNYQPDLLEPLGRTVSITFRKLFLPPPSFFREHYQQLRSRSASTGG